MQYYLAFKTWNLKVTGELRNDFIDVTQTQKDKWHMSSLICGSWVQSLDVSIQQWVTKENKKL